MIYYEIFLHNFVLDFILELKRGSDTDENVFNDKMFDCTTYGEWCKTVAGSRCNIYKTQK